jgi:molybdopterin molybdotransferase
MAQLSDDCFAFGGTLLPVEEAARLMASHVPPVAEIEPVTLADSLGRVVAADVISPIALPSFDNSAVDGYAVRHADLAGTGETRLKAGGRIQAGSRDPAAIRPGEAVRIFTGAPMPPGADTVFMQEDVRVEDGTVILPAGLALGANRRLVGEDLKMGGVALPAGRRLGPQDVALAAAIGLTQLEVRRRPRVAVFSTGDEITEPVRRSERTQSMTPTGFFCSRCCARRAPRRMISASSGTTRPRSHPRSRPRRGSTISFSLRAEYRPGRPIS